MATKGWLQGSGVIAGACQQTWQARALVCVAPVAALALLMCAQARAAVGRTPGSFAVSPSGAAQYTIPLWTPPGIGELTPQLSLTYNHLNGNGLLGMGWSIGGLSTIHRCERTVARDGNAAPAQLYDPTHQDRFCLDGQRLRWESGTYGVAGSQYRTEIESFARITAQGSLGTGPEWFKLEGRNGLTALCAAAHGSSFASTNTADWPALASCSGPMHTRL